MWVEKYVFFGKSNNNNVTKMSSTNYIDSKSTPLREVSPWTCPTCRTSCWSCPAACPSPAACSPSLCCSCPRRAAASQGRGSASAARRPPSPCPPPPGSIGSRRGEGWAFSVMIPSLKNLNLPDFFSFSNFSAFVSCWINALSRFVFKHQDHQFGGCDNFRFWNWIARWINFGQLGEGQLWQGVCQS